MNPLQWRHDRLDGVSNHQPHDCLLNRLFRSRSKKASKLRVSGLCVVNSPVTVEFPAQRASNAENVSIWCRHHATELKAEPHRTSHIRIVCMWSDFFNAYFLGYCTLVVLFHFIRNTLCLTMQNPEPLLQPAVLSLTLVDEHSYSIGTNNHIACLSMAVE